jgi:hypothetical protein
MMYKRFAMAFSIGFALFASGAMSDSAKIIARPDKADSVVIPAASTLRFRAFDQNNAAKFDGAIELSGTYYYGDGQLDDGTTERTLYLVPDAATHARLPHFKHHSYPDIISLSGGDAFASAVISKDQLAALHKKGPTNISGHIDIMADRVEVGLQCDAPYMSAHYLSVVRPPSLVAFKDEPDSDC